MAIHVGHIVCCSCHELFHGERNYSSIKNINSYSQPWKCSNCVMLEVAFHIDHETLRQTIEPKNLHLKTLLQFSEQSLLAKLPGQAVTFHELSHKPNTAKYSDVSHFVAGNFEASTSMGFLHMKLASLNKLPPRNGSSF